MVIIGNITGTQDCIGGIVGKLDCGEITGCYNKGNITSSGDNSCNVGGICGCAEIQSNIDVSTYKKNLIQYSYNEGIIKSACAIGGIVGYPLGNTKIEKCYNKGNIKNDKNNSVNYGGIVGTLIAWYKVNYQSSSNSQVNYTCNIGPVNSNGTKIGGICGYNDLYCIVQNSFTLQNLEIKKSETQASREIGTSPSYLGKYVGHAYSTSTSYINNNGEITNTITTKNGIEDITDTVYYIVNGMSDGESEYWAKDDVTQPSLKWEALIKY